MHFPEKEPLVFYIAVKEADLSNVVVVHRVECVEHPGP